MTQVCYICSCFLMSIQAVAYYWHCAWLSDLILLIMLPAKSIKVRAFISFLSFVYLFIFSEPWSSFVWSSTSTSTFCSFYYIVIIVLKNLNGWSCSICYLIGMEDQISWEKQRSTDVFFLDCFDLILKISLLGKRENENGTFSPRYCFSVTVEKKISENLGWQLSGQFVLYYWVYC